MLEKANIEEPELLEDAGECKKQIMDKAIGDIKGRLSAYHTEGVD